MIAPMTSSVTKFCEKRVSASCRFSCAMKIAMSVEEPTAKSTAMEKSALVKGMARLTALIAYSFTPMETMSPSTME